MRQSQNFSLQNLGVKQNKQSQNKELQGQFNHRVDEIHSAMDTLPGELKKTETLDYRNMIYELSMQPSKAGIANPDSPYPIISEITPRQYFNSIIPPTPPETADIQFTPDEAIPTVTANGFYRDVVKERKQEQHDHLRALRNTMTPEMEMENTVEHRDLLRSSEIPPETEAFGKPLDFPTLHQLLDMNPEEMEKVIEPYRMESFLDVIADKLGNGATLQTFESASRYYSDAQMEAEVFASLIPDQNDPIQRRITEANKGKSYQQQIDEMSPEKQAYWNPRIEALKFCPSKEDLYAWPFQDNKSTLQRQQLDLAHFAFDLVFKQNNPDPFSLKKHFSPFCKHSWSTTWSSDHSKLTDAKIWTDADQDLFKAMGLDPQKTFVSNQFYKLLLKNWELLPVPSLKSPPPSYLEKGIYTGTLMQELSEKVRTATALLPKYVRNTKTHTYYNSCSLLFSTLSKLPYRIGSDKFRAQLGPEKFVKFLLKYLLLIENAYLSQSQFEFILSHLGLSDPGHYFVPGPLDVFQTDADKWNRLCPHSFIDLFPEDFLKMNEIKDSKGKPLEEYYETFFLSKDFQSFAPELQEILKKTSKKLLRPSQIFFGFYPNESDYNLNQIELSIKDVESISKHLQSKPIVKKALKTLTSAKTIDDVKMILDQYLANIDPDHPMVANRDLEVSQHLDIDYDFDDIKYLLVMVQNDFILLPEVHVALYKKYDEEGNIVPSGFSFTEHGSNLNQFLVDEKAIPPIPMQNVGNMDAQREKIGNALQTEAAYDMLMHNHPLFHESGSIDVLWNDISDKRFVEPTEEDIRRDDSPKGEISQMVIRSDKLKKFYSEMWQAVHADRILTLYIDYLLPIKLHFQTLNKFFFDKEKHQSAVSETIPQIENDDDDQDAVKNYIKEQIHLLWNSYHKTQNLCSDVFAPENCGEYPSYAQLEYAPNIKDIIDARIAHARQNHLVEEDSDDEIEGEDPYLEETRNFLAKYRVKGSLFSKFQRKKYLDILTRAMGNQPLSDQETHDFTQRFGIGPKRFCTTIGAYTLDYDALSLKELEQENVDTLNQIKGFNPDDPLDLAAFSDPEDMETRFTQTDSDIEEALSWAHPFANFRQGVDTYGLHSAYADVGYIEHTAEPSDWDNDFDPHGIPLRTTAFTTGANFLKFVERSEQDPNKTVLEAWLEESTRDSEKSSESEAFSSIAEKRLAHIKRVAFASCEMDTFDNLNSPRNDADNDPIYPPIGYRWVTRVPWYKDPRKQEAFYNQMKRFQRLNNTILRPQIEIKVFYQDRWKAFANRERKAHEEQHEGEEIMNEVAGVLQDMWMKNEVFTPFNTPYSRPYLKHPGSYNPTEHHIPITDTLSHAISEFGPQAVKTSKTWFTRPQKSEQTTQQALDSYFYKPRHFVTYDETPIDRHQFQIFGDDTLPPGAPYSLWHLSRDMTPPNEELPERPPRRYQFSSDEGEGEVTEYKVIGQESDNPSAGDAYGDDVSQEEAEETQEEEEEEEDQFPSDPDHSNDESQTDGEDRTKGMESSDLETFASTPDDDVTDSTPSDAEEVHSEEMKMDLKPSDDQEMADFLNLSVHRLNTRFSDDEPIPYFIPTKITEKSSKLGVSQGPISDLSIPELEKHRDYLNSRTDTLLQPIDDFELSDIVGGTLPPLSKFHSTRKAQRESLESTPFNKDVPSNQSIQTNLKFEALAGAASQVESEAKHFGVDPASILGTVGEGSESGYSGEPGSGTSDHPRDLQDWSVKDQFDTPQTYNKTATAAEKINEMNNLIISDAPQFDLRTGKIRPFMQRPDYTYPLRVPDNVKLFIYHLHKNAPLIFNVERLAARFRIRREKIAAILRLQQRKAMEMEINPGRMDHRLEWWNSIANSLAGIQGPTEFFPHWWDPVEIQKRAEKEANRAKKAWDSFTETRKLVQELKKDPTNQSLYDTLVTSLSQYEDFNREHGSTVLDDDMDLMRSQALEMTRTGASGYMSLTHRLERFTHERDAPFDMESEFMEDDKPEFRGDYGYDTGYRPTPVEEPTQAAPGYTAIGPSLTSGIIKNMQDNLESAQSSDDSTIPAEHHQYDENDFSSSSSPINRQNPYYREHPNDSETPFAKRARLMPIVSDDYPEFGDTSEAQLNRLPGVVKHWDTVDEMINELDPPPEDNTPESETNQERYTRLKQYQKDSERRQFERKVAPIEMAGHLSETSFPNMDLAEIYKAKFPSMEKWDEDEYLIKLEKRAANLRYLADQQFFSVHRNNDFVALQSHQETGDIFYTKTPFIGTTNLEESLEFYAQQAEGITKTQTLGTPMHPYKYVNPNPQDLPNPEFQFSKWLFTMTGQLPKSHPGYATIIDSEHSEVSSALGKRWRDGDTDEEIEFHMNRYPKVVENVAEAAEAAETGETTTDFSNTTIDPDRFTIGAENADFEGVDTKTIARARALVQEKGGKRPLDDNLDEVRRLYGIELRDDSFIENDGNLKQFNLRDGDFVHNFETDDDFLIDEDPILMDYYSDRAFAERMKMLEDKPITDRADIRDFRNWIVPGKDPIKEHLLPWVEMLKKMRKEYYRSQVIGIRNDPNAIADPIISSKDLAGMSPDLIMNHGDEDVEIFFDREIRRTDFQYFKAPPILSVHHYLFETLGLDPTKVPTKEEISKVLKKYQDDGNNPRFLPDLRLLQTPPPTLDEYKGIRSALAEEQRAESRKAAVERIKRGRKQISQMARLGILGITASDEMKERGIKSIHDMFPQEAESTREWYNHLEFLKIEPVPAETKRLRKPRWRDRHVTFVELNTQYKHSKPRKGSPRTSSGLYPNKQYNARSMDPSDRPVMKVLAGQRNKLRDVTVDERTKLSNWIHPQYLGRKIGRRFTKYLESERRIYNPEFASRDWNIPKAVPVPQQVPKP